MTTDTRPEVRMTKQRRVILDTLRSTETHPTADEVYRLVQKQIPRISLGTVYRNLDLLARCGSIRKLDIMGGRRVMMPTWRRITMYVAPNAAGWTM